MNHKSLFYAIRKVGILFDKRKLQYKITVTFLFLFSEMQEKALGSCGERLCQTLRHSGNVERPYRASRAGLCGFEFATLPRIAESGGKNDVRKELTKKIGW
jgi:hypothetical protein